MKINIKTTNLKLTPSIKNYIEEKIGSFDKIIPQLKNDDFSAKKGKPTVEAWVEIGKTTSHHHKGEVFRAECQIRLPGRSLRAESTREELHLAIDEVKDELQGEIKKYREKGKSRFKKMALKIKNLTKFGR